LFALNNALVVVKALAFVCAVVAAPAGSKADVADWAAEPKPRLVLAVATFVRSERLLAASKEPAPDGAVQVAVLTLVAVRTKPLAGVPDTVTPFTFEELVDISPSSSSRASLRMMSQSVCPLVGITSAIFYPP
jgi:hypothetical protein